MQGCAVRTRACISIILDVCRWNIKLLYPVRRKPCARLHSLKVIGARQPIARDMFAVLVSCPLVFEINLKHTYTSIVSITFLCALFGDTLLGHTYGYRGTQCRRWCWSLHTLASLEYPLELFGAGTSTLSWRVGGFGGHCASSLSQKGRPQDASSDSLLLFGTSSAHITSKGCRYVLRTVLGPRVCVVMLGETARGSVFVHSWDCASSLQLVCVPQRFSW